MYNKYLYSNGLKFKPENSIATKGGKNVRILLAIGILAIMAVFAGCAEKQAPAGTTPSAGQPTTTPVSTPPPPVANAGNDQTVEAGKIMTYDASGSSDPGGSIVTYEWKITGAPPGHESIIGKILNSGPEAKWTTPWVMKSSDVGQWTMELTVTDNEGNTAVDSMVIAVTEATEPLDESADSGS